ncbi:MAG TPA: efflux RND transporter periplasmic adaptor subunit [Polyangiaceae bacterium]|nr:efflux RND transporter periplasmic adaptor subunit [Polyangiaceae bacterium]HNZ25275.1 efflux RND transporter periplasmic adaptor subunit [Polyangiaceae bacterium]HOD23118.1 efflux RND transporter periplasmic adaptor subunit [Polyangiaceae bacterium]HOE50869.1 efflux RND transporter periplasmic adaptor subunit [Polyangiaceae bacterium]HOH03374.1 efflux RND transporter periplasmic adaptor subunit [Polyangiaceae bacterium]
MKKVFAILTILVVTLSVALGYRIHQQQAYRQAPSGGSGVIEATQIDLGTRLSSRIRTIHVREGQPVQKGQPLVEFDCEEPLASVDEAKARLAMARAGVQAAEASERVARGNTQAAWQTARASAAQVKALQAERNHAEKEAFRLASLHTQGAISDSAFDTTETRVASVQQQQLALEANTAAAGARADAAYRSQQAAAVQITSAEYAVAAAEATLRRASTMLDECILKSPIDGVVLHRNYEPGELVLPGSRILSLVDLTHAKVTFYLPNAELGTAVAGGSVEVVADAWPGQRFEGTILSVAVQAEFTPRNVQTREDRDRLVYAVEVSIPNADQRLRPGMPVDVSIVGTGR